MVGDPWLRDARNKIYITFRAARRKFDDAVEEARAGREKGGKNRKEEPPLEVFLWVALLGVLAKVMMRERPLSQEHAAAARVAACQHATCSSSSSMLACNLQQQQQQQKQHGEQFHVAQEHLCA